MNNEQGLNKDILKIKADSLAHLGHDLTFKFPKEEQYCLTSQVRRVLISVPSNIIEGYSRGRSKVFINFLEIAYASLAEARYQLNFACKRGYITTDEYMRFYTQADGVSRMLWSSINTLNKKINSNN